MHIFLRGVACFQCNITIVCTSYFKMCVSIISIFLNKVNKKLQDSPCKIYIYIYNVNSELPSCLLYLTTQLMLIHSHPFTHIQFLPSICIYLHCHRKMLFKLNINNLYPFKITLSFCNFVNNYLPWVDVQHYSITCSVSVIVVMIIRWVFVSPTSC